MTVGQLEFTTDVVSRWAKLRPDVDLTALSVVQRLLWCGRLTEQLVARSARSAGLRGRGDYEVIALPRRFEPNLLTPNDVTGRLLTSPSGMTGRLDRLEERGFLRRTPDPEDRRAVRLEINGKWSRSRRSDVRQWAGALPGDVGGAQPAGAVELDKALMTLLSRLARLHQTPQSWQREP